MSDDSFDGALFIVKGLEVLNLELVSWGYSSLFVIADRVTFDQWCNVIVSVKSFRKHALNTSPLVHSC
jgi:hypothetical protein